MEEVKEKQREAELESAIEHSIITFKNILKMWVLTNARQQEIKSNIDYLNEVIKK